MTTYVVIGFNIKDTEKLKAYSTQAAPTVAKFEGEFLVKGSVLPLCGQYDYNVQAIIQFPSKELAESWYASEEYQALIPLRTQAIDCHFQIIE
ncbi:DUF1330 domain-containing protein [Algibacillus agarilyticus]|uniref:DUF1330 domain-containing protein n=1 Tax=Algibacillus agarilyticus TaxID=2234133 RepID=UPI000DCFBFE5|nr:DUF1330 domain-containing protein [Algibacillus agarilyticus]